MRYCKRLFLAVTVIPVVACSSRDVGQSDESRAVLVSATTDAAAPAGAGSLGAPDTVGRVRFADPASAAAMASGLLAESAGKHARRSGFSSRAEASLATPVSPLQMFMVRLDVLSGFDSQDDPRSLLTDLHQMMYPFTVQGTVRSCVIVSQLSSGEWQTTEMGHPNLASAVETLREQISADGGVAENDVFLVRILALGAEFLAYEYNGVLQLAAVFDYAPGGIVASQTRSASEVFGALQPVAARMMQ